MAQLTSGLSHCPFKAVITGSNPVWVTKLYNKNMANHKRKKSKRVVRCTLCNPYSWLGNNKEKTKAKYRIKKKSLQKLLTEA